MVPWGIWGAGEWRGRVETVKTVVIAGTDPGLSLRSSISAETNLFIAGENGIGSRELWLEKPVFLDYTHHLLLVYTAYLIAVASPGPSTMSIMAVAMNHGRASAIALALGVVTGIVFWAVLAATGISAVLIAWADAILAIKIAGGLYLLYLAWKSARSALLAERGQMKAIPQATRAGLYRRGVLIHLTNPKAILGWVAIMSLGLKPDSPSHMLPAILVGCIALGLMVNLGYAVLFSTAAMAKAYRKSRRWIESALAVILGYAGLRLLLSKA